MQAARYDQAFVAVDQAWHDDFLARNSLYIPARSPDRDMLARQMMRAEIEALQRGIERDAGDYTGIPRDPIVKATAGRSTTRAAPGEGIMDIFERYAAENPRATKKDTLDQARRDIGTFCEIIGTSARLCCTTRWGFPA